MIGLLFRGKNRAIQAMGESPRKVKARHVLGALAVAPFVTVSRIAQTIKDDAKRVRRMGASNALVAIPTGVLLLPAVVITAPAFLGVRLSKGTESPQGMAIAGTIGALGGIALTVWAIEIAALVHLIEWTSWCAEFAEEADDELRATEARVISTQPAHATA
jgi:hypothetical protein